MRHRVRKVRRQHFEDELEVAPWKLPAAGAKGQARKAARALEHHPLECDIVAAANATRMARKVSLLVPVEAVSLDEVEVTIRHGDLPGPGHIASEETAEVMMSQTTPCHSLSSLAQIPADVVETGAAGSCPTLASLSREIATLHSVAESHEKSTGVAASTGGGDGPPRLRSSCPRCLNSSHSSCLVFAGCPRVFSVDHIPARTVRPKLTSWKGQILLDLDATSETERDVTKRLARRVGGHGDARLIAPGAAFVNSLLLWPPPRQTCPRHLPSSLTTTRTVPKILCRRPHEVSASEWGMGSRH
jgi:hypothetical protein